MPTVKITLRLDATKYSKVQKHKINDSILTLTKHNKSFCWSLEEVDTSVFISIVHVFGDLNTKFSKNICQDDYWLSCHFCFEVEYVFHCGQLCQGFVMTVVLWFDGLPGDPPGGRSGWRRASRGSCWTGSQHWIASRTGWSSCSSWDRINQKKN